MSVESVPLSLGEENKYFRKKVSLVPILNLESLSIKEKQKRTIKDRIKLDLSPDIENKRFSSFHLQLSDETGSKSSRRDSLSCSHRDSLNLSKPQIGYISSEASRRQSEYSRRSYISNHTPRMYKLPGKSGIHAPRLSRCQINFVRLEKNFLHIFLYIPNSKKTESRLSMGFNYLKDLWLATLTRIMMIFVDHKIARGAIYTFILLLYIYFLILEMSQKENFYWKQSFESGD